MEYICTVYNVVEFKGGLFDIISPLDVVVNSGEFNWSTGVRSDTHHAAPWQAAARESSSDKTAVAVKLAHQSELFLHPLDSSHVSSRERAHRKCL